VSQTCDAVHPDKDGIICTDAPHPYGHHFDKRARVDWPGDPYPVTRKSKKDSKKDIRAKIEPEERTGPPTGALQNSLTV